MKNRYLYKAKRIDNGEWVEGYYFEFRGQSYIADADRSFLEAYYRQPSVVDFHLSLYEVEPSTIGQYTGLKDKNGKLIFENDILMNHDNPSDLIKAVFGEFTAIDMETEEEIDDVIGWHYEVIPTDALSKCAPFCYPMPLTGAYIDQCNMKVVGNIFDNPELLKKVEE